MVKRFITCIVFSLILWLTGLVFYYFSIRHFINLPNSCDAEAIIVLTGGHARIGDAINMLQPNSNQLLLISGTGIGVRKKDILVNFQRVKSLNKDRIFLGSYAQNTIDNAYEARAFMMMHDLHSLCLVTSDYHMPRSIMLFSRVLPSAAGYRIVPHAIPATNHFAYWQYAALILQEYTKFIYSCFLMVSL